VGNFKVTNLKELKKLTVVSATHDD